MFCRQNIWPNRPILTRASRVRTQLATDGTALARGAVSTTGPEGPPPSTEIGGLLRPAGGLERASGRRCFCSCRHGRIVRAVGHRFANRRRQSKRAALIRKLLAGCVRPRSETNPSGASTPARPRGLPAGFLTANALADGFPTSDVHTPIVRLERTRSALPLMSLAWSRVTCGTR